MRPSVKIPSTRAGHGSWAFFSLCVYGDWPDSRSKGRIDGSRARGQSAGPALRGGLNGLPHLALPGTKHLKTESVNTVFPIFTAGHIVRDDKRQHMRKEVNE